MGQLCEVHHIILCAAGVGVDGTFTPHKTDIRRAGQDSRHRLVSAESGDQLQIDPLIRKISFLDRHIHRGIEDGMCHFIEDHLLSSAGDGFATAPGDHQTGKQRKRSCPHFYSKRPFHKSLQASHCSIIWRPLQKGSLDYLYGSLCAVLLFRFLPSRLFLLFPLLLLCALSRCKIIDHLLNNQLFDIDIIAQ